MINLWIIYQKKNIRKLFNQKYVAAVGSGTDALMLSLKALGIKENDEVITTPYTFYATIGAIVTAGAKPVFVDVKEDYNLDAEKIVKLAGIPSLSLATILIGLADASSIFSSLEIPL